MGEITPELQALADAALKHVAQHPGDFPALCKAAEAYHATQAPKECRPPEGAKDGSWWWLVSPVGDEHHVYRWIQSRWTPIGYARHYHPSEMNGWTVHSECRFLVESQSAPKLREISDDEIDKEWRVVDFVTKHPPGVERQMARDFARAVIAYVAEGES